MNCKGLASIFVVLIVAIALAIGGGALYYAKKSSAPKPVACTQEAKQCPDGSYVSPTGPNCEFAACPAAISTGTLAGKVSIGPICPVEIIPPRPECMPTPETYASREFLVLSSDQNNTITSFHADASGSYSISLPPGNYVVVSAKTGIGYMSKDLPSTVTIQTGKTLTLNINVDTGIR